MSDNRPLASLSTGPYAVSLWENQIDTGDGSQRTMKSVSLRKGYFDKKQGKLDHQTVTINPAELGAVIQLLTEMQRKVIDRRGDEPF